MSKAQVTLFIILGIVILAIFAFTLYIAESSHEKKLEVEVDKTISDFLKSKTINYYVTSCLDKVSKEALILAGNQGGFIYKEQDGLITWSIPSIDHKDSKVAYQIYSSLTGKLKQKENLIYNAPYYPCFNKGPAQLNGLTCYKNYNPSNPSQKLLHFGNTGDPFNKLDPDLCKDKIIIPNYVCTCYNPPDSLNCKYSIQAQLADYIKKKMKECADFASIKGYDITAGDVASEISFSNSHVLFKINFPITIKVKGSQPIIEVIEFSIPQQIRFKSLYTLSRELIKRDIDDITFDIVKDGQKLANNYGNIIVKKEDTASKGTKVIILEDSQSKIDGKNYTFMFAIENRAPALDYMNFISYDVFDLYAIENQSLNFTPTAYDPDDHSASSPLIYDYLNWSRASNLLKGSRIYSNPNKNECVHPFSGVSEKKRCASYALSDADVGEYKLTLKVQDMVGEFDYQDINILIDDIPKINLILNNTFIDIDDNLASIEDPFIFDASQTIDNYPKPVTLLYSWQHIQPDGSEGFSKGTNWGYINKIELPKQYPDINNMAGFFDMLGTHNIKLEVKNQQATPLDNIAINRSIISVSKCLPHRSSHAPYPFNKIDWDSYGMQGDIADDFQGNHTCCTDNYDYANTNQICYSLEDFGCYTDFASTSSQYYDPGKIISKGISSPIIDQKGKTTNNIEVYKRTLIRVCSQTRGNTCEGQVQTYKIEWNNTCTGTPQRYCTHSMQRGGSCK